MSMDHDPEHVTDDLRGLITGDVRCDDLFLEQYASDASIFEVRPLGIVRPRSTEDVVAIVRYAGENQIPLHARGAGSGLAGESLGPGLMIDFSCHMRRIVHTDEQRCRVQAGLVLGELNRHLARRGRCFAPDPLPPHVKTIGGIAGIDAAGSRRLRHGSTRRHVESIQAVLADGSVHEFGRHAVGSESGGGASRLGQLAASLDALLERHRDLLATYRDRCNMVASGYAVCGAYQPPMLDLRELLVGSEGTLALFTEVTVRSEPVAVARATALLFFGSLQRAAEAVLAVLPHAPTACDLMDRRHLGLAREDDVRFELSIPASAEAVLLVEVEGNDRQEAQQRIAELVAELQHKRKLAAAAEMAVDPQDVALQWQLARKYAPPHSGLVGPSRPVPFLEDVVVPPEQLCALIAKTQEIMQQQQVTASLYGHAGHGQLHLYPILDVSDPDARVRLGQLADAVYTHVWELGGMIGGGLGDGLSRTSYLSRQFGPLCDVFRDVKRIFDPQNLLNPGKVVPEGRGWQTDDRPRSTSSLAVASGVRTRASGHGPVEHESGPSGPLTQLELEWPKEQLLAAARTCNGCGLCRSQDQELRMCPIFRVTPREEASPRAKANLLRALLEGRLPAEAAASEEFKQVVDLCVHCHMCRQECPAEVDIPELMVQSRAAYVRSSGLNLTEWFFAHIDTVSALGSRLRLVANWALGNPLARWFLERTVGLAQGRKLPRLARRPFMQTAQRRGWTRACREGMRAALFVDTHANYYDPALAEMLVAILQHHGISVFVPPGQSHSAMPLIAAGALEPARKVARHNVDVLAEAVRHGHTIVFPEPSAALALIHEYPHLFPDDDDVLMVSHATREACHFLWQQHIAGRLRLDFAEVEGAVGYHQPCHLKALAIGSPGENLLRLIPGLQVDRVERGCSGMAGTWGMRRANYRNSLRAGLELITALRDGPYQAGVTECSTCQMQMQQSTSKRTVHPLKVLAFAYGLAPEFGSMLAQNGGRPGT